MDAAAKTVESLSEHILPEKPHHLSYNPHWRYRPRPEDSAPGARPRFEEWHNPRLQYMTLVSQADRGTLLTRPYYDMREEPPKPVPREVSALAAGGDNKKKKLSLSDYKNKKTGTPSSASPPEPAIAKKLESERAALPTSDRSVTSNPHVATDQKPAKQTPDSRRPDGHKALDSRPSLDGKPRPPRDGPDTTYADRVGTQTQRLANAPSSLPPKPPSLPPKPPSPAARKRTADIDDELRPQKRSRPDDRRPVDDRPLPPSKDDLQRRKDRLQPSARENPLPKEDRLSSSSSLPNGRAILKGAANAPRNPSPGARPRGDSTNGVRPSLGGSNRGTPTKSDASKSFVPPLLSPLHLSFDDQKGARGGDEGSIARKKKRDESRDRAPAVKMKKPEPAPAPPAKKNRPPLVVPPLLSPTLPPMVEAELRRKKNASPEPADEKYRDGRDALGIKRKPAPDKGDEDSTKPAPRRRLLVKLEIPKHLRQSVKRLLAPPTARKEAAKRDQNREREKERERERERDRDRAGSDDASQPLPARKRPMGSTDSLGDSLATKRPRVSDAASLSRVAATPATPSRKPTAMSRVSSGNSIANTPGEGANATPMTHVDRRPNGNVVQGARPDRHQEIQILNEKEDRLKRMGKTLKHDADLILRSHRSPSSTSAGGGPSESKIKRGYALALEGITAFVMSFQAMNLARRLSNRKSDPSAWLSMLPLLDFLQAEMRRDDLSKCKPPLAVLLMFHAVCLDEVLRCYANLDNTPSLVKYEDLLSLERRRSRYWPMIRDINSDIDNADMRVVVSAWYTLDEVTAAALDVLRLWCEEENIDWSAETTLTQYWPIQRPES
ncbi:Ribonucleoside-diphosphate reductase [Purpureocillium lavendulum]|uniref:Ribonucleoside-diphosphate reductase n=1 Tax=Purpureocillium lavendulum TaxID=1247861 RepID=A0AB34FS76_9HYPO|nr:Ribonucleoside-diphosphate reductase [Purpureocillium lavendulum]